MEQSNDSCSYVNSKKRQKLSVDEKQQFADDVDDKKNFINLLNLDLFAKIFMLLPIPERLSMEEVCYKWKQASQRSWHDVKKYTCRITIGRSKNNLVLTQSYVEKILLRCGKYLEKLILSEVCDSTIMPIIGNHCKNLTTLVFVFNQKLEINQNHFSQAFEQLDQLKFIKITEVNSKYYSNIYFPTEVISCLSEGINEIHLIFENKYCESLTPLYFTLEKFKELYSLTLHYCNIENIIQEISEKITLVCLDIQYCDLQQEFMMFNQLVNLEKITIRIRGHGGEYEIGANSVISIFDTCKKLEFLTISLNVSKSIDNLFQNSVNFENLVYLDIPILITDNIAMKIVRFCKNLESLHFQESISMTGFKKIVSELKNIQHLTLPEFNTIDDESMHAILNNCKKLKSLKIACTAIVDSISGIFLENLSFLDDLSNLKYLEKLNFEELSYLQDSTIIAIADKCKNLKYLKIGGCGDITEKAYMSLTNLEKLTDLFVHGNSNVTDKCIINLKKLKGLDCSECYNITDDGIIQLIKNSSNLEYLDISEIDNITIDAITVADEVTKKRIDDYGIMRVLTRNSDLFMESPWLIVHDVANDYGDYYEDL